MTSTDSTLYERLVGLLREHYWLEPDRVTGVPACCSCLKWTGTEDEHGSHLATLAVEQAQVVTAAEAAPLAPSPCGVKGHLKLHEQWETIPAPDGGKIKRCSLCSELTRNHDGAFKAGEIVGRAFGRAELERVRKLALEEAARTAEAAWTDVASLGACKMAADSIRKLIPAEDQGGPKEPK